MSRNKCFFVWVLLALFLMTSCASARSAEVASKATPTPIPNSLTVTKSTFTVKRGEVLVQSQFIARIVPVDLKALYFQSGGRVANVYFNRGDQVKKGQVMADLVGVDDIQARKANKDLDLHQAQIELAIAQLQLDQVKLHAYSEEQMTYDVKYKELQVEMAQINLERVKLQNNDIDQAVETMQIIAPFDGQVISMSIRPGKDVTALSPIAEVANIDRMEVGANLISSETVNYQVGMPCTFEVVSRPGTTLSGKIRYLPSSDPANEDDKLTRVSIDQIPRDLKLELEEMVRVTVTVQRKPDALWLPPQAIRSFEGRKFVLTMDGDTQKRVDVKIGLEGAEQVEILEGLTDGQIVIGR